MRGEATGPAAKQTTDVGGVKGLGDMRAAFVDTGATKGSGAATMAGRLRGRAGGVVKPPFRQKRRLHL
jgi:hypothetical protein